MEEASARTRPCENCKREIPEDNFTIHSVYCSRNLRICQQCKEPVAIADMEKHTAQVPCSQCGETMQACDIPAHKTDACSLTQVHCIYCELSLERAAMAEHELYCGSRTEKCPECSELILIKYKKLHEESNHSFIKLDDEPGPQPSWEVNALKNSAKLLEKSRSQIDKKHSSIDKKHNQTDKKRRSERIHSKREQNVQTMSSNINQPSSSLFSTSSTNNFEPDNLKPIQQSPVSRGAIKKRIAPQPPINSNSPKTPDNVAVLKPFKHTQDVPMYKAMERSQEYKKELDVENEYRSANNLPLLLNPSQKIEKLRKMSALQNMEYQNNEYNSTQKEKPSSKSQRTKTSSEINKLTLRDADNSMNIPKTKKNVNIKTDKNNKIQFLDYSEESDAFVPAKDNFSHSSNIDKNYDKEKKYSFKPLKIDNFDAMNRIVSRPLAVLPDNACAQNISNIPKRDKNEINYKTSNKKNKVEFLEYSDNLDTFVPTNVNPINESKPVDRFCDIKNDLQALRKELKKCSSPLENRRHLTKNTDNNVPTRNIENVMPSPINLNIPNSDVENCGPLDLYKITNEVQPNPPANLHNDEDADSLNFVMLPCEFCEQMIQASSLVAHEVKTGCRPNITSFANDKNSFNNLCENAAPPNTPDGHHTPKLSNVNIYNEKQVKKKLRESEMNIREPTSPESNQNTAILPPEEEIDEAAGDLDEVKLPCEFCMTLVPACRLVWHQEACYAA